MNVYNSTQPAYGLDQMLENTWRRRTDYYRWRRRSAIIWQPHDAALEFMTEVGHDC